MRAQTMSTILALILTYLTFALLIQASPLLSGRDIAGVLSADTVSGTSISNAGYNCSPVGTYDCGGPSNTTIVSFPLKLPSLLAWIAFNICISRKS